MSSATARKHVFPQRHPTLVIPRFTARALTPAGALLQRLSHQPDIAGHGVARLQIARLADSANGGLHELAQAVLADAFIAQKLLRAANVVVSRSGSAPVTTISRAIVVVGLDRVKAVALSTMDTDRINNRAQAARIHDELAQALYATTLARELAATDSTLDTEEAAVCTLMRGFGRLVAALYLYEPYEEALALCREHKIGTAQAAVRTLGMSFDRLGVEVLNRWGLPQHIVQAALPCPPHIRPSGNQPVKLRILAEFCAEIAAAVRLPQLLDRRRLVDPLFDRFGHALDLSRPRFKEALRVTDERARKLGETLGLFAIGVAGDCLDAAADTALTPSNQPGASLTLATGVTSLGHMMARNSPPAAILKHAAEVLYRAFDFQRVVICLKQSATGTYAVHTATGQPPRNAMPAFGFHPSQAHDLFNVAIAQNRDVYIRDAGDPRVRSSLPEWFRHTCPDSHSFLLLPLGSDGGTLGFCYADHRLTHVARLTQEEVQLIRTLKQQAWIAARQLM